MTEAGGGLPEGTAGQMLRAAREQRGLHIAVLAASVKVPQRKLEALEADRYDQLPDITFVRALAQAVCRHLKVDPAPVLARLPQSGEGQAQGLVHVSNGLATPYRGGDGQREVGDRSLWGHPAVWASILVLVAAVVLALLPDNLWQRVDTAPPDPPAPEVAAAAEPASVPDAVVPQPAATTVAPAEEPPAGPAGDAASAAAPAPAPNAVQLRVTAASWVEVRDASGKALLSRTLQPNEAVDVDGSPPLRLTIGNARATHVQFRGRTVDLAPATGRDNVARLELK